MGDRTRLGEHLLRAVGLDTARLETYLRRLADDDSELAQEVRRRVASTTAPASFLALPAAERLQPSPAQGRAAEETARPADSSTASSAAGSTAAELTRVSERYALGPCLGEGGMARVFAAFDHRLSRPVALKFLTRDDPEVVGHLLREARAQARVRHEHVLEIYDTGVLDGRPFISMALISGQTLGQIRHRISLEEQVRLSIQVAEGLHAAHGEGLIHRDVKPSNVLVEEQTDGSLKALIADFGIASEAEDAGLGTTFAGTPSFMAPELLRPSQGLIDRRVDVYSLGVTLYEMLTGEKPHRGDTPVELIQQVLHGTPPAPRQLVASLSADLEAIVLRCMAKDPAERYPSTRAVADELRRFLAGEVVEAYAAGLAYRLTRFVLRHKPLVVVAGVAALALVVAMALTVVFAVEAGRERERAEDERARADQRRLQAEELIDFMVVDLRQKLASVERLEVLEQVDAAALEYFAAVPAEELSDTELAQRSRHLYQIGEVRFQKGDLEGAVRPFEDSLDLARHLVDRDPDDGNRLFDLGQSYFWLGFVRFRQSDPEGARAPFEAYLEIGRRLTELDPENLDWRLELSYAHSNLGAVLKDLGDLEDALDHFEKTLAIDQHLAQTSPKDLELRYALAGTHNALGELLQSLGRLSEARDHFEADLSIQRQLSIEQPSNHRFKGSLGTSLDYLGSLLLAQGDLSAAVERLVEAEQISAGLMTLDPERARWRFMWAWARIKLGEVAYARRDLDTAEQAFEQARQILEEGLDRNLSTHRSRRFLAISHYHLGNVLAAQGAPAARFHAQAALELLTGLITVRPEDRNARLWLNKTRLLLGRLAELSDRPANARTAWRQAEQALADLARGSRDGRLLAPWAEVLLRLDREDEAHDTFIVLAGQGFEDPDLLFLCRARGYPWCGRASPSAD